MSNTWPPAWTGSQFKDARGTAKRERRERKATVDKKERDAKGAVRKRDKFCRFPLCGCRKHKRVMHVSHQEHKGIGGNPAGDRSTTKTMILLCADRHNGSRVAIHAHTIEWTARNLLLGANAGIVWWMSIEEASRHIELPAVVGAAVIRSGFATDWIRIAVEERPGTLSPLVPWQRELLDKLAKMDC